MQVDHLNWTADAGWQGACATFSDADLILFFGDRHAMTGGERYREMRALYPKAHIVGSSTGGQIRNADVNDHEIVATAVRFAHTKVRVVTQAITGPQDSAKVGEQLGAALAGDDLAGVFLLSDGLCVNGSHLVASLARALPADVPLSGGLAGDGDRFETTMLCADCEPCSNIVVAIGFYGRKLNMGIGVSNSWDVFGPRRRITRSNGGALFELDGKPALELYERHLGEDDAKGLPGTGLLFPIQICDPERPEHKIVRTILAINREDGSMTFAGDMPEGWTAQLMRGDFDRLEASAGDAGRQAASLIDAAHVESKLAILVSCVGRRWLLGQRISNELDAVEAGLGGDVSCLGFYSYGEIAPHPISGVCELHNQTMSVTVITEAA